MKMAVRNAFAREGIDLFCLAVSFLGAFLLRFDIHLDGQWMLRMGVHMPFVLVIEWVSLRIFGATRGAWRYVSISDVRRIVLALFVAQVPLVVERILLGNVWEPLDGASLWIMPLGVIFINLFLSVVMCTGVRVMRRMIFEKMRCKRVNVGARHRILIVGTGANSKDFMESIRLHPELGLEVAGIISNDSEDVGREVMGVCVLGNPDEIPEIARQKNVDQAVILQSACHTQQNLRHVMELCVQAALKTCIVPRMDDVLKGTFDVVRMRDVSVEDLLHREPVTLDKAEISKFLSGKRILVSGAGGSIGSEICRQVLAFEPTEIVLLERCELFLYDIERELRPLAKKTKIIPRLTDICDSSRVMAVFEECRPEIIFHAAAYKHVPMLEYNPGEAIRNNVYGTKIMADSAVACGVSAFVMISTDKAVNPTSVMGTSKRIAELYIEGMSTLNKTRFCAVRFGNVLGSTGSVLPLFREQIRRGEPLTVTHADMVRYFMTIPEASQLVMQAVAMAKNGEIFVLDMGEPVKIVNLARDLIRLSGKTEKDIPIIFSGMRPGEKLFEELGFHEENMDRTKHPKIYVGKLHHVALEEIRRAVDGLMNFQDCQDNAKVRAAMHAIVPEMQEPGQA